MPTSIRSAAKSTSRPLVSIRRSYSEWPVVKRSTRGNSHLSAKAGGTVRLIAICPRDAFRRSKGHGQVIEAGLKFGQHGARFLGQHEPRRARRCAVKQLYSDNRFQAANETAHRRRRHVEFICRRNIAEVASRGLEGAERI
jgi:hypothetical protein